MISFSRLAASIVRSHSSCQAGFCAGAALSAFGAAVGLVAPCPGAAVGALVWPDPAGLAVGAAQAASVSTARQRTPRREPPLTTGMMLLPIARLRGYDD